MQPYIPNIGTKTIYHNLDYQIIEQLYHKEYYTTLLNTTYGKVRNMVLVFLQGVLQMINIL